MPRLPLHPASGTGRNTFFPKCIRFVRYGCANRPFYHIVVMNVKHGQHKPPIEQLGSYDPLPNKYNERIAALNLERIQHWVGRGAEVSRPLARLLGIAGFFPIHPTTYLQAWRNRRKATAESNMIKNAIAESEG